MKELRKMKGDVTDLSDIPEDMLPYGVSEPIGLEPALEKFEPIEEYEGFVLDRALLAYYTEDEWKAIKKELKS